MPKTERKNPMEGIGKREMELLYLLGFNGLVSVRGTLAEVEHWSTMSGDPGERMVGYTSMHMAWNTCLCVLCKSGYLNMSAIRKGLNIGEKKEAK